MTQKITLIVPLRLTANTHEGELRLKRLCATVPRDLYDILISDYGTEDAHAGPIRALAAEGIDVVSHPSPGKIFSIGHARDFGVQMARQKVTLFNDIDFLATPDMYRQIHAEVVRRNIAANLFDFFCVPVLFLTEAGTTSWLRHVAEQRPFVERNDVDWLESVPSDIQFTAFGSSAIVVNRHHYLSLGGHDPDFSGHGAEDYDLLHRLASLAPKGPRPHDYHTDYKTNSVRQYWGFRPFFALYGLEAFQLGLHLVHLWHPRRKEKGYFRSRPNFRHLKKVMLRFDRNGGMPLPLTDPNSGERWLVYHAGDTDVALMRQILPFCAAYRFVDVRKSGSANDIKAAIAGFGPTRVFLLPGAQDKIRLDAVRENGGIGVVRLVPTGKDDVYRVEQFAGPGDEAAPLEAISTQIGSNRGIRLIFWKRFEIAGLPPLESGTLPAPQPLTAPLFESFGGPGLADPDLHKKPEIRTKSPLITRIFRTITGL